MQPHWGGILTQIFVAEYFCFSCEMMLKPMGCHLVPPLQNKRSQSYHSDYLSGKHGNLAAVREMFGNSPKVMEVSQKTIHC